MFLKTYLYSSESKSKTVLCSETGMWRRERFILHKTTIQLWKLWRTKQSGSLPERHKAHRSWPAIV